MARFIKDRSASKGQLPGSLILIGKQKMDKPVIRLMEIGADELVEKELENIDEAIPFKNSKEASWINVWGIHDLNLIARAGEIFELHPLLLEDILNTDERPRYEAGETYDAFILKMLQYNETEKLISSEQITVVIGQNYVLTLQEQVGDVFDILRERIRSTKKRTRFIHSDYLAYTLLDTIIDNYILITEAVGREIEALDEKIFAGRDPNIIEEIYKFKTELSFLRKSIRPVREILYEFFKTENGILQEKYLDYFKDLNELISQSTEAIELYSGMISDHLNIYSTLVNNRINDVMKVLTIFASIFIPLTFLAGIYGMNFKYFPELSFRYSYLIFWIVALAIGGSLLIYFKRKKWL